MNGGEYDEMHTVRGLQSIRYEIGLMSMMNCRDGELELVRNLVSAVSRTTSLLSYLCSPERDRQDRQSRSSACGPVRQTGQHSELERG